MINTGFQIPLFIHESLIIKYNFLLLVLFLCDCDELIKYAYNNKHIIIFNYLLETILLLKLKIR
jgi:hypothetical protein